MGLKLNGATSGSIELDPQADLGSDRVITLNATGNSTLTLPDSNGTLDRLERAGNILQVKQTHLTTRFSIAYTSGVDFDVTGLNVSLTPRSSSSKVLIFARLQFEINATDFQDITFNLTRNDTFVGKTSDAPGSRKTGLAGPCSGYYNADASSTQDNMSFNYLDSPNSTAALTYQVAMQSRYGTTIYINRAVNDTDNIAYEWMTSSITAMEVAG
jgi:hypothetical protein